MGGKTFIKDDINPASRIDVDDVSDIFQALEEQFGHFFHEFDLAEDEEYATNVKKDLGDLDIIVRPLEPSVRKEIRELCEGSYMLTKVNGPMEHILFPYKGFHYQIDLIFCKDEKEFKSQKFFYSRPITFNAILGHLARSIGYKFSTEGLLLRVVSKSGQTSYINVCKDPERSLKILGFSEIPDGSEIYESPESFAAWIMSSPRFDSKAFFSSHNKQSHRDSKQDEFCRKVYLILDNVNIKSEIPPANVNYQEDPDLLLMKTLAHEYKHIYYSECKAVEAFGKEEIAKNTNQEKFLISGKNLCRWGYKSGPIFQVILRDITARFNENTSIKVIKSYVENKYSLTLYGKKANAVIPPV
jgi:hypothetical protein